MLSPRQAPVSDAIAGGQRKEAPASRLGVCPQSFDFEYCSPRTKEQQSSCLTAAVCGGPEGRRMVPFFSIGVRNRKKVGTALRDLVKIRGKLPMLLLGIYSFTYFTVFPFN